MEPTDDAVEWYLGKTAQKRSFPRVLSDQVSAPFNDLNRSRVHTDGQCSHLSSTAADTKYCVRAILLIRAVLLGVCLHCPKIVDEMDRVRYCSGAMQYGRNLCVSLI